MELFAAGLLALAHLTAGGLRALWAPPRSGWLSAAGGIAVAYVFVHLLPEVAEAHERTGERAFPLALAGLVLFYAVEQHSSARRPRAFEFSMTSFAVYNGLIGYLIARGREELALFTLAMAVHFVVNDLALSEHHRETYDRVGRWLLAAAVLVGWAAGQVVELDEEMIGYAIAFIAGGVILNTIKEELPGERQARILPFLAGAAAYTVLLLAA
jgi:hypothetical protein